MADIEIPHGSNLIACTTAEGNPCELCKQYIDLDPEIMEAKARVIEAEKAFQVIEERRRVVRATINNRHDRLASRLPAEILSEIFKATLTRKLGFGLNDHIIDSPLYLGAVCRSWRRIAWSTPRLWNWLHIFLDDPENIYLEETVEQWLARCGKLPLTIQITCGEGVIGAVDQSLFLLKTGIFSDFVSHINACSARWQNISFIGPSTMTDLLHGSSEGTPNLQIFRIHTTDGPDHHFRFAVPSRPQSLFLVQRSDRAAWDGMNIVWDNLNDICFSRVIVPLCVEAIKEMPRLRHCILFCDGGDGDNLQDAPSKPFIHPYLETFKYRTDRTPQFSVHRIFDHFIFPNLTELSIASESHADDSQDLAQTIWEESIKPFVMRSSSNLQTLKLKIRCTFASLVEVLGETHKLSRLDLTDLSTYSLSDFPDLFLYLVDLCKNLNLPQEDGVDAPPEFLGALKSLFVEGHTSVQFDLIACICGRSWDPNKRSKYSLKRMIIVPHGHTEISLTDDHLRQAGDLIEAGIDIQIRDPITREDGLRRHVAWFRRRYQTSQ